MGGGSGLQSPDNKVLFWAMFSILMKVPPGEAVNLSSQAVHGLLQRTPVQPFQFQVLSE